MAQLDDERALSGSLADAEAAMHKGRAGSLLIMGALGLSLIGGLVFFVGGQDRARVYGEIGRQINGLGRANFDRFWGCALQGENVADIRSNAELATQLDVRGRERGRAYGVHLRDACLPKLTDIGPKLDTLIVPADLQKDVDALKHANSALRSAVSGFATYLDDPDLHYDPDEAKRYIDPISRAWYDFKKAHAGLNESIKVKLK